MIRDDAKIKIEYRTDNLKPPERKNPVAIILIKWYNMEVIKNG